MNPDTKTKSFRKLWLSLICVIVGSFLVLGYFGSQIWRQAPPMPKRVVTTDGAVLFTGQDIKDGQNVWQSIGGQEVGTVWGHGSYVAPDWTADWLHREATWLLDHWAVQGGYQSYEQAPLETQAMLSQRLKDEIRPNTYDVRTGDLVVSPLRAGDTVFALGTVSLGWFVLGLKTGWSFTEKEQVLEAAVAEPALESGAGK